MDYSTGESKNFMRTYSAPDPSVKRNFNCGTPAERHPAIPQPHTTLSHGKYFHGTMVCALLRYGSTQCAVSRKFYPQSNCSLWLPLSVESPRVIDLTFS